MAGSISGYMAMSPKVKGNWDVASIKFKLVNVPHTRAPVVTGLRPDSPIDEYGWKR